MMNYTNLKKYIPEYIALVIIRHTNNINESLEQEQIATAFVREGFTTRKDLAVRALNTIGFEILKPYVIEGNIPNAVENEIAQEMIDFSDLGEGHFYPPDYTWYALTDEGIEKAQEQEYEMNAPIDDRPLAEQLGFAEEGTAPAADRIVKLDDNSVPLKHDSEPYKKAMTALDDVMTALDGVIAAFQSEGKNDFEEEERVQKELQAGKTLLEAPSADPEKIKATLIKTLKWIGIKFAENAIANLAVKAVKAIAALIGISS